MTPVFQIIDPSNSATITLNDNLNDAKRHSGKPAPVEQMIIGREPASVAFAVLSYAKRHGIDPRQVGYSITFDDGKCA